MKLKKNVTIESLTVTELFLKIQALSLELETKIIPKLSILRNEYFDEWNKFDDNSKPNAKKIVKAIKTAEPLYKEYLALHDLIRTLKAEISKKTGVKDKDMNQFYEVWNAVRQLGILPN